MRHQARVGLAFALMCSGWLVTPHRAEAQGDTATALVVVDLHPLPGQTFHALLMADLAKARQVGRTPFLELGGTGCGVCHAVHRLLDTRPVAPPVRAAFAGTYIIRIAIEEWRETWRTDQRALGLGPEQGIPAYLAVDASGHVTHILNVDDWTLSAFHPAGQNPFRQFFLANGVRETPPRAPRRVVAASR